MNKISLISLTLSFLFTICNGLVPSAHSDDTDSKATESSASVGDSSESTEPQATSDETEKKETKKTKKSKRARRGTKGKRGILRRRGGVRAQSADNKLTDDLNRMVLSGISSVKEVSSQSN